MGTKLGIDMQVLARAFVCGLFLCVSLGAAPALSASGDRELYLYYTHTKETARIVFKRNGKYDQAGLKKLNWFLRDWRRNEPTKMDPKLFDLIWEVYHDVGATQPIHIVSAFRAPETNNMLRKTSSGVAKNSQHTHGKAMDFFIPGIPLKKLREAAFRRQVGGVGYYPTSGSPFVHLDTASVRAWPRMTRAQLQRIFPEGKTLHVPSDGGVLSQSGYQYAKAEWTKCHTVPCSNGTFGPTIRVADNKSGSDTSTGSGGTLVGWLFGNDGEGDAADDDAAAAPAASTVQVAAAADTAPVPLARPAALFADAGSAAEQQIAPAPLGARQEVLAFADAGTAPVPAGRPDWLDGTATAAEAVTRVAAVSPADIPAVRSAKTPAEGELNPMLSAYAPASQPVPEAQRALQMLIERRLGTDPVATASTGKPSPATPANANKGFSGLRLASTATDTGLDRLGALFRQQTSSPLNVAPTITAAVAREPDFVAPDFEHIVETFIDPNTMSSKRYAVIMEEVEGDLNPQTELGRHAYKMGFSQHPEQGLGLGRFRTGNFMLLAAR